VLETKTPSAEEEGARRTRGPLGRPQSELPLAWPARRLQVACWSSEFKRCATSIFSQFHRVFIKLHRYARGTLRMSPPPTVPGQIINSQKGLQFMDRRSTEDNPIYASN